ncbi:MAG: helix-turn-helix domain-containing protein [Bacteroidota bacterium]
MKNILLSTIPIEELKEIISDCLREELQKSSNSSSNNSDELIKIDAAAKLLQVSKVTLYKWRAKKLLPYHRISSRIYFKKSELMECITKSKKR